jgi:hypothetical protein
VRFPFVLNREGFPKRCQCASLTALIRFVGNNAEAVFDGLAVAGSSSRCWCEEPLKPDRIISAAKDGIEGQAVARSRT